MRKLSYVRHQVQTLKLIYLKDELQQRSEQLFRHHAGLV